VFITDSTILHFNPFSPTWVIYTRRGRRAGCLVRMERLSKSQGGNLPQSCEAPQAFVGRSEQQQQQPATCSTVVVVMVLYLAREMRRRLLDWPVRCPQGAPYGHTFRPVLQAHITTKQELIRQYTLQPIHSFPVEPSAGVCLAQLCLDCQFS